jgi:hypothetical protein
MVNIKALREQLKQENQRKNVQQNDGAGYPFWNIDNGSIAQIRFLPDGDESNLYFWRERKMINLEFDGVVGQTNTAPVKVQVPSVEMWGEQCPILTEARRYYKEGNNELGQKYWAKRSYVFQAFIRVNPLVEENVPENPIRRLLVNPSLFKIIHSYLMDDDNEYSPTDYVNGCDFRIHKTQQGQYASYDTSNFSRKDSPLTSEEVDAIEKYGLFNLNDFLPKKPDADALRAIQEMFEASLDGDPYDPSRFGNFYRPYGLEVDGEESSNSQTSKNKSTQEKSTTTVNSKTEETTVSSKPTPQELLARLKSKQQ